MEELKLTLEQEFLVQKNMLSISSLSLDDLRAYIIQKFQESCLQQTKMTFLAGESYGIPPSKELKALVYKGALSLNQELDLTNLKMIVNNSIDMEPLKQLAFDICRQIIVRKIVFDKVINNKSGFIV